MHRCVGFKFNITLDSKPLKFRGKLEIYAATQIPAFSPNPLAVISLTGTESVELDTGVLNSISDTLWPKTSIEADSTYRFNVVLLGDSEVAIAKGLGYRKSKGDVIPANKDQKQSGSLIGIYAPLIELVSYQGSMDNSRLSEILQYHLFIFGTGFDAKGIRDPKTSDPAIFNFAKIPKGLNECYLISIPDKEKTQGSGKDSASLFSLEKPLETGIDTLLKGSIFGLIELPDSLKIIPGK